MRSLPIVIYSRPTVRPTEHLRPFNIRGYNGTGIHQLEGTTRTNNRCLGVAPCHSSYWILPQRRKPEQTKIGRGF